MCELSSGIEVFIHCDRIYVFNPSEIIPQFSLEGNNRLRVLGL